MNNFYCLICKRITTEGVTMPCGSDYAGHMICVKCACEHFDKAIRDARRARTETVTIGYWHTSEVTT